MYFDQKLILKKIGAKNSELLIEWKFFQCTSKNILRSVLKMTFKKSNSQMID